MYFDLSKNGLATGVEAKLGDIAIAIDQEDAVTGYVYDIVLFYTRILQINGEEFRVMV